MKPQKKPVVVDPSVNYAELAEINYVELIYYKMGQSLWQTAASVTKWDRYCKVEQELLQSRSASRYCKVVQELLQSWVDNILQSGVTITTK